MAHCVAAEGGLHVSRVGVWRFKGAITIIPMGFWCSSSVRPSRVSRVSTGPLPGGGTVTRHARVGAHRTPRGKSQKRRICPWFTLQIRRFESPLKSRGFRVGESALVRTLAGCDVTVDGRRKHRLKTAKNDDSSLPWRMLPY